MKNPFDEQAAATQFFNSAIRVNYDVLAPILLIYLPRFWKASLTLQIKIKMVQNSSVQGLKCFSWIQNVCYRSNTKYYTIGWTSKANALTNYKLISFFM